MEAEAYLSSGFGIRMAIQAKTEGWMPFSDFARVWSPGRLKGIQVSRDVGTPFLAATQVFDVRPIVRKWLAVERTADAESRFVHPADILVTCSGSVGRPTVACDAHVSALISHDLLRIEPKRLEDRGWLYAYLLAAQTRAMSTGAQYGHIIKHLEPSHLEALPVPTVTEDLAFDFLRRLKQIVALRNDCYRLTLAAETRFEQAVGSARIDDWGEQGFAVSALARLARGRRRFEASAHNPGVTAIRRHLLANGKRVTAVSRDYEVWLPTRFRRVPAEDGVLLVGSAQLVEVNPDLQKRISDDIDFGDANRGRVKPGWVLMARSGQTYGVIGTAILSGNAFAGHVISDHVMRFMPIEGATLRPGYLVTALSHPLLGRPLVKALAYGSSIPEIEVADMRAFEVVRLADRDESEIADLAEASARARAEADLLERGLAADASAEIARFLS